MRGKIVFISPDEKLAVTARKVIKKLGEDIEVLQGSLGEGAQIAREEVDKGANIIISRGETGNLISRKLQVPVVNVDTDGYDIIYAVSQAMAHSNRIGFVGFEKLIGRTERLYRLLKNLFSIQLYTAVVTDKKEVEEKIQELYLQGVRVFCGGKAVVNAVAKISGCVAILLESGEQVIQAAIEEAKYLFEVQLKEKEKAEVLKSIIDFAYDGIISVDIEGKITVFNPIAEKITGCSSDQAIGKFIDNVVENTRMLHVLHTGKAENDEFQKIGNVTIATNRIPIIVNEEVRGVVATFQEVEKIQKMEIQIRKKLFLKGHVAKTKFHDIIGTSQAMQLIKVRAAQFAQVDSTILIQGETGTGKELFAQSIHNGSQRVNKPFVAVNCAALPESLLESELFGYVEGAFTGARKEGKLGLFELAHNGTIFLDEISEMSPNLQARFLRILQEKEVIKIGDDRVVPIDIRVVAATNRDLLEMVKEGSFREDLYYRLCVLQLVIPPLRERIGDIVELARHFVREKGLALFKENIEISDEALSELAAYSWPGNVRQLENVVERAVVLCHGNLIDIHIIKEALKGSSNYEGIRMIDKKAGSPEDDGILRQLEDKTILRILNDVNGNKTLAAKKLGISVTTLWRRLKQMKREEEII